MEENNKGAIVAKTIHQIMHVIKHGMKYPLREVNLTVPQGMLIGVLSKNKKMKVSDLSEQLQLSNSTVSGIIDRLEKQGMVERTRSEEDRRVVYVSITKKVEEEVIEHCKSAEKKLEDMLGNATDEELDQILHGLFLLEKVLERNNQTNKVKGVDDKCIR
ncbi:MAG: MarR family transcriptional regulator [Clostridiales bacterium]|nr:MarR family transcriptional regulator [Clostridiales bacterium]